MGQAARVHDGDVEVALMQSIDEGALVIRLEEDDRRARASTARLAIPAWISSSVS